jgi:hypothetical protein
MLDPRARANAASYPPSKPSDPGMAELLSDRIPTPSFLRRHVPASPALRCNICEPCGLNVKDCCELAVQILGALRNLCSGRPRSMVEHLARFQLSTSFCGQSAQRDATDPPFFLVWLPALASSTLIRHLGSFFAPIPLDCKRSGTRQQFTCPFPRFLAANLGRDVWNHGHFDGRCPPLVLPRNALA